MTLGEIIATIIIFIAICTAAVLFTTPSDYAERERKERAICAAKSGQYSHGGGGLAKGCYVLVK